MKLNKLHLYIFALVGAMMCIASCSTKKNTAMSRGYQAMTTRFNVYYNGNEALKKSKKKIEEAYRPDYTRTLKMYAVSDETANGAGKTDASYATEKCEKAIKLHSMRKKPIKKVEKMKDPKYAAFYAQEEFNPMMDDVWMLLGKSKFYANDYLAASATFTYVQNHFSVHPELVTEATIWKAKALKELNWIYEAEELMTNIDEEKITYELEGFYNATMADIKLCQNYEEDALPYLLKSIKSAENKTEKTRLYFIIGQIYQNLGKREEAYAYYDTVVRKCPIYEMEFNARIRQTEVYSSKNGQAQDVIRKLEKLAKNEKNKDYLDQIYYAIANVYLNERDTANAVKNYKLAAEKSTRNGVEKAVAMITLGRLYWNKRKYVEAEPFFAEASSILSHEHPDYNDVSTKALKLTELKQNYDIVHLQDSLIALAKASPDERLAAIKREIKKVEEEEKREYERRVEMERQQKLLELEIEQVASENVNANSGKKWYFYNQQTVSKGKLEFQRKFGQRRLEDNWNRKNKASVAFGEDALTENEESAQTDEAQMPERGDHAPGEQPQTQNLKSVDYYMKQIPLSPEQQAVSLSQVESALFNEAVVYDEKIEDYPLALETFLQYIRRFGDNEKVSDAYFYCYRLAEKMNKQDLAVEYKDSIIAKYPTSKYAQILSTPDYQERLVKMNRLQDSLYNETYAAYLSSDFEKVKMNADYMEENYALSGLMPKFKMLKALSYGKQGSQDSLQAELKTIIDKYPISDVTSMAKDIVALIEQGGVTQAGTSSSLAQEREQMLIEENENLLGAKKEGFTFAANEPYLFYLITDPEETNQNMLLFNVATYNFDKFMVKDFELKTRNGIISVSGLENLDEALWYANGVKEDSALTKQLENKKHTMLVISESNSVLIGRGYTIEQYEEFYRDSVLNRKTEQNESVVKLVGEEKEIEEAAKEEKLEVKEGDDLNGAKVSTETPAAEEPQTTAPKEEQKEIEAKQDTVAAPQAEVLQEEKAEEPKKELRKYKNLYTFDRTAKHYFAILIAKGAVNSDGIIKYLNDFNADSAPLLNLKVEKTSGKNLPTIITVGKLADSKTALDYLKQIVRSEPIKNYLQDAVYKHVIITQDNLDALKSSGNVSVYMELFKRGYLGK